MENVVLGDGGIYKCRAVNSHGSVEMVVRVRLPSKFCAPTH